MGFYINIDNKGRYLGTKGKTDAILRLIPNSKKILPPTKWEPNLVCVVDNGSFDAAGYAYDENEMNEFLLGTDDRPTQWLIVPDAAILSGYAQARWMRNLK